MRTLGKALVFAATGLFALFAGFVTAQPQGLVLAGLLAVMILGITGLILTSAEGMGMFILGLCFFTAPYFRLFQLSSSSAISAIDPMLMVASVLLLPRITRSKPQISPLYLGSAISLVLIGYAASLHSSAGSETAFEVTQWAFLALILPVAFMALDLTNREITWFALLYIGGQMASSAFAVLNGPDPVNGRYQGLAEHPNYFADGAMMSVALLLHLYHHPKAKRAHYRIAWWLVVLVCFVAIYYSGARGPALGLAAVLVLVPIVERSSLYTFFGTLAVVLGALIIQPIAQSAAQGSLLARLTGADGTGTRTSEARLSEWQDSIGQITHSPFLGNGLTLDVLSFHNNYLEIAAGIGLFGLAAYLIMLWSLTQGLFGSSAERRLLYPMVAFAVYGLTQPGFKDRSNWLPMLLGIAVFHGYRTAKRKVSEASSGKVN